MIDLVERNLYLPDIEYVQGGLEYKVDVDKVNNILSSAYEGNDCYRYAGRGYRKELNDPFNEGYEVKLKFGDRFITATVHDKVMEHWYDLSGMEQSPWTKTGSIYATNNMLSRFERIINLKTIPKLIQHANIQQCEYKGEETLIGIRKVERGTNIENIVFPAESS